MEFVMDRKFLLVGTREESPSFDNLWKALTSLGKVEVYLPKEALQQIANSQYEIVLVDAGVLDNHLLLISEIRAVQPNTRILVLTASPTWRRAREALKAGAIDYLSKSLDAQEYFNVFRDVLKQVPSPRT
jgi:DNA-binding NtrC family response regulator